MTVIDTAGNAFIVTDAPGIDHAWKGYQAKKTAARYVQKAKARCILVRKLGCQVVEK